MNPFLRYLANKHSAHRQTHADDHKTLIAAYGAQVIIIIISAFVRRTMSASELNLRRRIISYMQIADVGRAKL